MVEIRIKYQEKVGVHGVSEKPYRWWELSYPDEDRVYVEHLMPLHGGIYFNQSDYERLKQLAEAHKWKVIVT